VGLVPAGNCPRAGRFADAVRQAGSLEEQAHRPWPVPAERWLMGQTWEWLLFAHWRVPHDFLRPHVPYSLVLEEFDGSAWVGLTRSEWRGSECAASHRYRVLRASFELNCRTYVRREDRPGTWFFSLHCSKADEPIAAPNGADRGPQSFSPANLSTGGAGAIIAILDPGKPTP
jgi:hypothetical protein